MKQAILVVAFGSTVDSAREHNIDSVVEYIRKAYPDYTCLLYTSPSPRDYAASRMPSSA